MNHDLMKNFLKEDWNIVGSNETSLINTIDEVSDRTITRLINPSQLTLYSIVSIVKDGLNVMVIKPDDMDVEILFPIKGGRTYFDKDQNHYGFFSYERFRKMGMDDELLDEIRDRGYFLRYSGGIGDSILLIPSACFMATLCRQLNCGKLPDITDPFRDIFIAYLLRDSDDFKMVYREGDLSGKAFACFTSKYTEVKQKNAVKEFLTTLKCSISNAVVSFFKIDHFITTVKVDFPGMEVTLKCNGKRKVVKPCVTFTMSDVGDASFTLQNCLSVNGHNIRVSDPVMQPHKGEISISALVECYLKKSYLELEKITYRLSQLNTQNRLPKSDTMIKVLDLIQFQTACGVKTANMYKKSLKNNSCVSSAEIVLELLNIPGNLELFYQNETKKYAVIRNQERRDGIRTGRLEEEVGKELAVSVIYKMEAVIGNIFVNKNVAEVIEW